MTTPRAQGAGTGQTGPNAPQALSQRPKSTQVKIPVRGDIGRPDASSEHHEDSGGSQRRPKYGLPRQTEAAFQAEIIKFARGLGWTAWHDVATNAPRRCGNCGQIRHLPRNPSGHPDLILIKRPRIIWVELKAQDGVVSDAQTDWIEELLACGQEAYVWRPSDAQRIAEVLTR